MYFNRNFNEAKQWLVYMIYWDYCNVLRVYAETERLKLLKH